MDWFRKMFSGGLAGWRRTDGRAGSRGGPSNRKLVHRQARKKMKQELKEEQE